MNILEKYKRDCAEDLLVAVKRNLRKDVMELIKLELFGSTYSTSKDLVHETEKQRKKVQYHLNQVESLLKFINERA